jgi:single-strand DNA-binding protein
MESITQAVQTELAINNWNDKNEVHLCGVLIREPESRYTSGGKLVCNFSLCTQTGEHRTFHNCVAWEALAEQIAAVKNPPTKKRQRLRIVGRLNTRVWERDGDKRTSTEIICRQIAIEGAPDEN